MMMMIDERSISKDMEGSAHRLLLSTKPEFAERTKDFSSLLDDIFQ
jgi:hypothetical protein